MPQTVLPASHRFCRALFVGFYGISRKKLVFFGYVSIVHRQPDHAIFVNVQPMKHDRALRALGNPDGGLQAGGYTKAKGQAKGGRKCLFHQLD